MKLRITSVDYAPPELEGQTPFQVDLLREIPCSDRPDCWIAAAVQPIRWLREGQEINVTHLIVWARWQDRRIGPGMTQTPIGIAYVTDSSVLHDPRLDFRKCFYVAIGAADELQTTT